MLVRDLRRRAKLFLAPTLALCLVLYFTYHLIEGGRGIHAWRALEQDVHETHARVEALKKKNEVLERNVSLLKSDICPHLLEEEAKRLGFGREDEVVVVPKEGA